MTLQHFEKKILGGGGGGGSCFSLIIRIELSCPTVFLLRSSGYVYNSVYMVLF